MKLNVIKSTLILIVFLSLNSLWGQSTKPRRLEILFLGDNGHHKPVERLPSIMSALGNKGINFTYTDKLEDINLENLNRFDALMIYANWDEITPQAETAILAEIVSIVCFQNCPPTIFTYSGEFLKQKEAQ